MQKLCCVCTRQHPLPVWSHKFVISSLTHFSINSRPFLVGIVSIALTISTKNKSIKAFPQTFTVLSFWTLSSLSRWIWYSFSCPDSNKSRTHYILTLFYFTFFCVKFIHFYIYIVDDDSDQIYYYYT